MTRRSFRFMFFQSIFFRSILFRPRFKAKLMVGLMTSLMGSLTACSSGPMAWVTGGEAEDGDRVDPYVQFTQAVTEVEPLVSPELEALARSQSNETGANPLAQTTVLLPKVVPLEVEGNVAIATSPKLLPLNERMYERFVQGGYQGIMDINAVSSSKAILQFCQQDSLGILTISRAMTEAEIADCQAQSRSPVGIVFGKDALVLVVNAQNEFLQGVTLDNLSEILTQNTWSAIRSNWPQRPIVRHLIGPNSDTVSALSTRLFGGTNAIATTKNTQYFGYAEPMMQALSTSPDGVGMMSYATFRRSLSGVKALPINGITASPDTIAQGTYPLQQTLYLYVDQQQLQSPSPVIDWVNFYLNHTGEVMPEIALLPLRGPQLKTSINQWSAISDN